MEPDATAPPVVVVVVTCDPGSWFDETLSSVANQDYPNLSVLVVDSASTDDPTSQIKGILPGAFVRRMPGRVGFGKAANEVLDIVDGASHYLFCHDDVALAPDALRLMVEEAFRSNAGIVSPKLLEWERPEHLLGVGTGADRVGVVHPLVERGELDQEQHDGVRDVFVAPGGATLVRADLFAALGGFDADIVEHGEDLDLSWRVQIAGARVIVAPAARVRHLEASDRGLRAGTSSPVAQRSATARAELHRIRTVLACYGPLRLLWIVPLLVVHALAEALWRVVSGRPGDAAATLGALGGALRRPGRLWRSRRGAQRHRRSSDRDIGMLQSKGSARMRAYIRSRFEAGAKPPVAVGSALPDGETGLIGDDRRRPGNRATSGNGEVAPGVSGLTGVPGLPDGGVSPGGAGRGYGAEQADGSGLLDGAGQADGSGLLDVAGQADGSGLLDVAGQADAAGRAGRLQRAGGLEREDGSGRADGLERADGGAGLAERDGAGPSGGSDLLDGTGRLGTAGRDNGVRFDLVRTGGGGEGAEPVRGEVGGWRLPVGIVVALLILVVVGSRSLLDSAIPAVGSLPTGSGSLGHWWHSWWSTWRSAGLGSKGPGAPGLGLLALLGTVLVGAIGTAQHVVILGPLVLGPLGAYRAARWWGSTRGCLAALVVYATVPVPYDALARGRWAGLVAYGAAPWLLVGIGRLSGGIPFPTTTRRSVALRAAGVGLLVAVVSSVAPAFVFVVVVVGVGMLAGSVLCRSLGVGLRCLGVSAVAAVVAAVLLLPWSASVLTSRAATFGVVPSPSARRGLGQLLLFHTGPVGNGVLGWALLVAAALPLLIGRSWRLEWATRMWLIALVCVGVTWAGSRGWIPVPDPEVLLAPAAAALAAAVALGAVAFELDLPGYRFGWRQLASGIAAVSIVVAAVPAVQAAGSGRWDLPSADAGNVLGFLPDSHRGDYRVLWVGDPGSLPLRSNFLGVGVAYATSFDGLPDATDQWPTRPDGSTSVLAADLRLASGRLTTKLGHLLAPLAVRYIVVPSHLGPSGASAAAVPTPEQLLQGLGQQTDLQALGADVNYTIYVNAAWAPARAVLTPGVVAGLPGPAADPAAIARALERLDMRGSAPALTGAPDGGRGSVPTPAELYVASSPAGGWTLTVGGKPVVGRAALGGGEVFAIPYTPRSPVARVILAAPSSVLDRAGQVAEILVWLGISAALLVERRRRRDRPEEGARAEWFVPIRPTQQRRWRRSGSGSGSSVGADLGSEDVWIDV